MRPSSGECPAQRGVEVDRELGLVRSVDDRGRLVTLHVLQPGEDSETAAKRLASELIGFPSRPLRIVP